jgi:hypothetical protein
MRCEPEGSRKVFRGEELGRLSCELNGRGAALQRVAWRYPLKHLGFLGGQRRITASADQAELKKERECPTVRRHKDKGARKRVLRSVLCRLAGSLIPVPCRLAQ